MDEPQACRRHVAGMSRVHRGKLLIKKSINRGYAAGQLKSYFGLTNILPWNLS